MPVLAFLQSVGDALVIQVIFIYSNDSYLAGINLDDYQEDLNHR